MSESTAEDLLILDFDPDVLINLLGKLSLENMPLDVTETLLSLENKNESIMPNGADSNAKSEPHASELPKDFFTAGAFAAEVKTDVPAAVDLDKESFLSSIGLVSGTSNAVKNSRAKSKLGFAPSFLPCEETSYVQLELPSNNVPEVLSDEPCLQDEEFDRVVKGLFSTFCDKIKFGENECFSSAGQSNETFNYPFHELFKHHGKVIDIQLNDIECSSNTHLTTPILSSNEASTDSDSNFFPLMPQCSKEELCTENIHVSTDKCVSSPDSGYTSCSSAISPCSPPDSSESQYALDLLEDTDEDLQSIVAAIVEVENSMRNEASAPASACNNVPVLGDAQNPDDHKERILNFLKDSSSVSISQPSSLKQPEIKDKDSSSSELQPKNIFLSERPCFTTAKKSPSKSKEWKLGYELNSKWGKNRTISSIKAENMCPRDEQILLRLS